MVYGDNSRGRVSRQNDDDAVKRVSTPTHGVAVSPDNRFAFVTVEGVGDDPGTVDVIDLNTFKIRASIDVGKQASTSGKWSSLPAVSPAARNGEKVSVEKLQINLTPLRLCVYDPWHVSELRFSHDWSCVDLAKPDVLPAAAASASKKVHFWTDAEASTQ